MQTLQTTHPATMTPANAAIYDRVAATTPRSAWGRGVRLYALELLYDLEQDYTGARLLNGAQNWRAFSYGGCSLIYDQEIAERLSTSSEYKRSREGELSPNESESWPDCQARALAQAANLIAKNAR